MIGRADKQQDILDGQIEQAREDERRRIALLLHDDIGQEIAALSIKFERLKYKLVKLLPGEKALLLELIKIEQLLRQNQQTLRNLAHILHPSILEQFGLAEGLRLYLENLGENSKKSLPSVSIEIAQDFPHFDVTVETGIYRIVQESVTNALKHSGAKLISLKLQTENNLALVIVHDDGCGFDAETKGKPGIGLASMCERAQDIHAKLTVNTDHGKGTTITLSLPDYNQI